MDGRINIAKLRGREVVRPDDHSLTRFAPFVANVNPSEWDALLDAVQAAHDLRATDEQLTSKWALLFREDFDTLRDALARFDFGDAA